MRTRRNQCRKQCVHAEVDVGGWSVLSALLGFVNENHGRIPAFSSCDGAEQYQQKEEETNGCRAPIYSDDLLIIAVRNKPYQPIV